MKFTVDRDVFADVVTWVARFVPQRPAVNTLAGVKISASPGTLKLASYDFEVSAALEVEADVEQAGEQLISGRLLAEIAKVLPSAPVRVELEGTQLMVTCGQSHFELTAMPLEDYPEIPEVPPAIGTVDAAELSNAISQVVLAASKEETLPVLASVYMRIRGNQIVLMASDRYRLARREITWQPTDPNIETTALVKGKVLADMSKSFPNVGVISLCLATDADTQGVRKSIFGMSQTGRHITSLLMDGDYPDLESLFPSETPISAVLERRELLEALRRMRLVSDRGGRVGFVFTDECLILNAGEGGEAQAGEEVECQLSGDTLSTAFNPDYLIEGLSATDEDYVKMGFTDASKAAVVTGLKDPNANQNNAYRYLVMPLHFGA